MNIECNNQKINEHILESIEELWGYKLPQDYRNFLLKYNGGIPKKRVFNFKNEENGSIIDEFFGIIKNYNNNILLKQKYSSNRVPENTLPIARDSFGNLILISVKNSDRGKIYFWDHELEADTDNGEVANYSNLVLIADSFDEFINGLYEYEED